MKRESNVATGEAVRRQRAALTRLACEPGFLASSEGAWLLEQLRILVAPPLVRCSVRMGFLVERDEVVNTAVERLLSDEGRIARYAAVGDAPLAYVVTCARGWMQQLWGQRSASLDGLARREEGVGLATCITGRAGNATEESELTPLDEVVASAFALVKPVTALRLHEGTQKLLQWFAVNPPQRRSYEHALISAARTECAPEFTAAQVTAVMHIVYGTRPNNAATSVFGALLRDRAFRVSAGSSYAVALEKYRRRMHLAEVHRRSLLDWQGIG